MTIVNDNCKTFTVQATGVCDWQESKLVSVILQGLLKTMKMVKKNYYTPAIKSV